jgi:hypothetical protein
MPVITRSTLPDLNQVGIHAIFGDTYNEFPPEWSQIFETQTSTKGFEDFVQVGGFGLAPLKTEGAPVQYDTDDQGPKTRFEHRVYALGFQVTREADEDGQYQAVVRRRTKKLARSMRTTAEIVHANVLNFGFSNARLGGDGVPLFSLAHPAGGGQTYANKMAVDADLTEASLEDMLTLIDTARDNRGLPIVLRGMKLVVAPGAAFNARRILDSPLRSGTPNNDINAVREMGLLSGGVVTDHYLTDPDAWYIITDADEGLISMWRRQPEITRDNEFDTENMRQKSTMRFACGWADPRAIYGSQGA